jgi:hypothetical protein
VADSQQTPGDKAGETTKAAGRPTDDKPLESLLGSVERFVGEIGAMAAEAAPQGEQQALIRSTGDSLVGQTGKLTAFVRETADRLSAPQRVELGRFLAVQDGDAIAARAIEVTRSVLAGGILGKLPHWIAQLLQELKKILVETLRFLFELLHLRWPSWIDRIFQIIDELKHLEMSLLSEVFGGDFALTSRELSEREVSFLHEMTAFEALRVVQEGRKAAVQEE